MRFILFAFLFVAATALSAQEFQMEKEKVKPKPGANSFSAIIGDRKINCTELNSGTAICDCDHESSAKHTAACKIVLNANCSYHPNDNVWTCRIDPK